MSRKRPHYAELTAVADIPDRSVLEPDRDLEGRAHDICADFWEARFTIRARRSPDFPKLHPWIDGQPLVILQDGKPIDTNVRRERLTLDDLTEAVRKQGIAMLDAVAGAVMETSGSISFITRSDA